MILVFSCSQCQSRFTRYRAPLEVAPLRGVQCPSCKSRRTARDLSRETRANASRRFEPFFSDSLGCFHDAERLPGEIYNANNDVLVQDEQHRQALMKKARPGGYADRRDWSKANRCATSRSRQPRKRRPAP